MWRAYSRRWSPVTPRHFAWQAWHLVTFTFVSRGRRGTISHPPSFCVACMAFMALCGALGRHWSPVTPRHFAWQAWHLETSTFVSRGRCGTRRHPRSFCVAGVALMALCGALGRRWSPVTPRHFAWQAWHLVTSTFVLCGRRGMETSTFVSRIHLRFAGQAWHLWHCVARLVGFGGRCRRGTLRGRRGTWRHPPSFHVAGVAQGDIHLRFAWQAWHLWHCVARLRSRLVTGDAATLCVAGVALGDIHLRFAWQACHLETSTFVSRGKWHNLTSPFVLRGRRGTYGTAWRTWSPYVAVGRR